MKRRRLELERERAQILEKEKQEPTSPQASAPGGSTQPQDSGNKPANAQE